MSASRPHLFDGALHPAASASAATILGNHLAAVHNAVLSPGRVEPSTGDTIEVTDASRGPTYGGVVALFDEAALDAVTDLAVRHAEGLTTMRGALDVFQQQEAAATAAVLATVTVVDPSGFLERAMVDAARLEAHFIEHAGHQAETIGRSKDDVLRFWIDFASFSIGEGLDRVPPRGGVPVLGELLGPAADIAKELFADHEAGAERDAEADAEVAADRLLYVWYMELYAAGVVTPDLPPAALDGGQLVSWSEFHELSSADQATVRNRMREDSDIAGQRRRPARRHQGPPGEALRRPRLTGGHIRPAGARPSISVRPSSHARRRWGGASSASGGRPVIPIGRRAFQRISIIRRSSRTYSAGQSAGS